MADGLHAVAEKLDHHGHECIDVDLEVVANQRQVCVSNLDKTEVPACGIRAPCAWEGNRRCDN
jgi:hypothetical protein